MIKHPNKDQSESKHSVICKSYLKLKYEQNINKVINKVTKLLQNYLIIIIYNKSNKIVKLMILKSLFININL